jgi:hypothetical protein
MTTILTITGGIVFGLMMWVLLVCLASLLLPHGVDTFDKSGCLAGLLTYLIGGGVAAWLMM